MRLSGILLLLVGFAEMISCSDSAVIQRESIDEEAIKKEIAMARDGFFEAWKNGDVANIISYLSTDFVNMPTIDITEDDYEAFKETTYDIIQDFSIEEVKYERIEIFIHADMAYELGWLDDTLIEKETGETMEGHQRSMMVWKKNDDGTWMLYRWLSQE